MKIPFASLGEGKHEFFFREPAPELGLEAEFSEVDVSVTVEKSSSEVRFCASVKADRRSTCDRCLTEFIQPIVSTYTVHYVFSDAEAVSFDPAEVQVVSPSLSAVELDEDVRQTIEIAVPLKLLCNERCKGLCPQCGKNLNNGPCTCELAEVDPRWESLQNLRRESTEPDHEM